MLYQSSKGPVEISTMPFRYASNALGKLKREAPERVAEIEALEAHLATADDSLAPTVGDNNPPKDAVATGPQSWGAIKINLDDLLDRVRGITGIEITDQAMADQAGQLLRDLQAAASAADDARVAEKKPLDDAAKEIQDRYNEYIAPIKNKVPGLASKAELALKNQIGVWLRKLDAEQREREQLARDAAEKASAEARDAAVAARSTSDLDEIDTANELLAVADDAARELRAVAKDKPQIQNEGRAIGLRSVWRAERIDGQGGKALAHYAKAKPDRVIAFLQLLADDDVKSGVRGEDAIPGFKIIEDRVV